MVSWVESWVEHRRAGPRTASNTTSRQGPRREMACKEMSLFLPQSRPVPRLAPAAGCRLHQRPSRGRSCWKRKSPVSPYLAGTSDVERSQPRSSTDTDRRRRTYAWAERYTAQNHYQTQAHSTLHARLERVQANSLRSLGPLWLPTREVLTHALWLLAGVPSISGAAQAHTQRGAQIARRRLGLGARLLGVRRLDGEGRVRACRALCVARPDSFGRGEPRRWRVGEQVRRQHLYL